MSDICERLKARSTHLGKGSIEGKLMDDAIAEIERLRSGWISVKDRLPEKGLFVVLIWVDSFGEQRVSLGSVEAVKNWERITHWKELPPQEPK